MGLCHPLLDFKCSEVEKLEKGRVEKEKRNELKKERRRRRSKLSLQRTRARQVPKIRRITSQS